MRKIALWTTLVAIFSASSLFAQRHNHSNSAGHEVVTIQLDKYRVQMQKLNIMQIDVTGIDINRRLVDVNVTAKELKMIQKYMPSARLVSSRSNLYNGQRRAPDKEYYTLAKVEARLKQLQAKYPRLMATKVIGKSLQGRSIYAVKLSDNVSKRELAEPVVLFNAMHHSREVMTTEVAMDTIETLLGTYSRGQRAKKYLDNNEIWVVPMLNVDGNNIVWTKDNMWRKNGRGSYGVDINRNYPFNWKKCNGSSGSKWSQTYRGESAGSEPETQALMNLVKAIRPVIDISYHSYSELVIYPFGCKGEHTPQMSMVKEIGQELARKLPKDRSSGFYTAGTAWEILYSVDGGDIDWMYGAYNVLPYVIELNSRREGFQPDYKKWRNATVKKARAAWAYTLDRMEGPGLRGYVKTARRAKASVMVRIKNLDNPSMKPHTRRINPDGTFHMVLAPGSYQLTLSDGSMTKPPIAVTVGAKRIDRTFTF